MIRKMLLVCAAMLAAAWAIRAFGADVSVRGYVSAVSAETIVLDVSVREAVEVVTEPIEFFSSYAPGLIFIVR